MKKDNDRTPQDELTTEMQYEFVSDEISHEDFKVFAVSGAIKRGLSKEEALARYKMTEEYYDANIERVMKLDF